MAKRVSFEITAAFALVLVAAFLPWAQVDLSKMLAPVSDELDETFNGVDDTFNQMFSPLGILTLTVWNGHAGIGALHLPNWLVLIAAVVATLAFWLSTLSGWQVRSAVSISCAGYGLAHCSYVLVNLLLMAEGSTEIGIFLATLGFAWMLFALVRRKIKNESGPSQAMQKSESE